MIQSSVKFEFFAHCCQMCGKGVIDQDVFARNLRADPSEKIFGRNEECTACLCTECICKFFVPGRKIDLDLVIFCEIFCFFDAAAEIIAVFRGGSKPEGFVSDFSKK